MKYKKYLVIIFLLLTGLVFSNSSPIIIKEDTTLINQEIKYMDDLWKEEIYNSGIFEDLAQDDCRGNCGNIDHNVDDKYIKYYLDSLSSNTPFNLDYNYHVKSFIQLYLKKHKIISKSIALSKYYFPLFEEVFSKYNIPLEMKYLAIVESALNPKAKSHAGAGGIWQFIYSTGKLYGLDVTSYVDERYSPIRATEASAKFMTKLYEIFGDWNLVLAAYNSGPGNVTKAMRRSGKKSYWEIWPFLPRETRGYVPAFIAVNYLMNNYKYHNIKPEAPFINFHEIDTLYVKETIKFEEISIITGIPIYYLEFLNPSYKLNIIPKAIGKNYYVILPKEYSSKFLENEKSIYEYVSKQRELDKDKLPEYKSGLDYIRHKIKKGETLIFIAKKYGVSVSNIKKWNGMRNSNIYPGKRLLIYPRR